MASSHQAWRPPAPRVSPFPRSSSGSRVGVGAVVSRPSSAKSSRDRQSRSVGCPSSSPYLHFATASSPTSRENVENNDHRNLSTPTSARNSGSPSKSVKQVQLGSPSVRRCAVCSEKPLLFQECPECAARYCASGCLQSWYEHAKSLKSNMLHMQANIDSSDGDYLKVRFLQATGDDDEQDIYHELSLTRMAGGLLIASDADAEMAFARARAADRLEKSLKRRRWSVSAVDGWTVGMPAPGADWCPTSGVRLTLEELGHCQVCSTPLATPEYICNSALGYRGRRSSSRAVSTGGVVQAPRTRTTDAETQTEVEFYEIGTQASPPLSDTEIQASPPSGFAVTLAEASIAASAIAELAAPSDRKRDTMRLVAAPESARRLIRSAICCLARVATQPWVSRAQCGLAQEHSALLQAAISAIKNEEPNATDENTSDEHTGLHVLGCACRAALPRTTEADGVETAASPFPDDNAAKAAALALACGALAALRRWESAAPQPLSSEVALRVEVAEDVAVERLLSSVGASNLVTPSVTEMTADTSLVEPPANPLHDAVINVAAMFCTCVTREAMTSTLEPLATFVAVAQLLPHVVGPETLTWRHLAAASSWPGPNDLSKESKGSSEAITEAHVSPPGWILLRDALQALGRLGASAIGGDPEEATQLLCAAIKAVARLALFVDAQQLAMEDAKREALTQKPPEKEEATEGPGVAGAADLAIQENDGAATTSDVVAPLGVDSGDAASVPAPLLAPTFGKVEEKGRPLPASDPQGSTNKQVMSGMKSLFNKKKR